ncbi:MAG: ferrous iron transport protein B [Deltaproteobacteria bacterium]|nr:ferrous iron transport protein B [Deltaproteobacteria bacterium]
MTASAVAAGRGLERATAVLVGRQNAGKTSLLMHLTGRTQKPVNFPGSSVERGESEVVVDGTRLRVVDLPGVGSLTPLSPDEEVAVGYLHGGADHADDRPDVVCAVIDASKLAVELTLVAQLAALPVPVVVALNKLDVAQKAGRAVTAEALTEALGVPVVVTNALTGRGAGALRNALLDAAADPGAARVKPFDPRAVAATLAPEGGEAASRSLTDRLDDVLIHRVFGLPILLLVMFGVFQALFTVASPFMDLVDAGQGAVQDVVRDLIAPGALQSFLVDGLINGIGSVVVFLPQIALLMLLVALLEGSGYMARAAFLLDRPLSRVGLSGRSFVPLVSAFACAVPAVMATRIIDNERDRIATIVVAPLMSCSARLPVYALLIGAFFPAAYGGVVLLAMYLIGIVVAAVVALILRRSVLRGPQSSLMMELPVYQRPSWRVVGGQVWAGCRDFLVLAGTVIFAASVVIWLLSYYPRPEAIHATYEAQRAAVVTEGPAAEAALAHVDALEKGAYLEQSFLADIGRFVHPVFAPAGWDWRTSVGVLAAFPARELVIPTLGVLYSLGDVDPGDFTVDEMGDADTEGHEGLRERLANARHPDGTRVFGPLVAVSVMVFFALCSQCMGTLATIRRETRSWRWPVFTFTYMTVLAWIAAVAVFQIGRALGFG